MWRVQGLLGRVLHRYHASGPLRLPQNHHVEDEVLNTSSLLPNSRQSSDSSSQRQEDGERRRKQRTSHFSFANLPRYTALDAVGWGAAAVLFMQVCRRIHSQFSTGSDHRPTKGALTEASTLHKCGYRILLETLVRRDVLPRGRRVLCVKGVPETRTPDQSVHQSSSIEDSSLSYNHEDSLSASPSPEHHRPLSDCDSSSFEDSLLSPLDDVTKHYKTETTHVNGQNVLSEDEKLEEAAHNLGHVGDSSVPVILNIIGLQNANSDNYEEAFTCFLAAAHLGYPKAQFNIGVCYEKGRGVSRDLEKAIHYYRQAAANGHAQAQYRCAKLLLSSRTHLSDDELKTATDLLEKAFAAGITKDNTALLFLGQCYRKGLGVPQNLNKAVDFYIQATKVDNKQERSLKQSNSHKDTNTQDVLLRSIRSAPCFQRPLLSLGISHSLSSREALIPHSWSTNSLCVPPTVPPLLPQSKAGGTCKWTLGIG
ncbi:unnamed protein product [Knipowitschia caucasica]|uniref:Death ligand signal enhancer n=1 Tax=Knipowitschia caucasica TaxID=637954 RepID=A0AAV2MIT5_KNICA